MIKKCNFCNGKCIKNGFQLNGNQRCKCSLCKKRQQSDYKYNAYRKNTNQSIIQLTRSLGYVHATDTWIQGPNNEQINNVEELNVILSKYSSQWRDFYKSKNGKLTLVIKGCNAGNEEGGDGITNKLNVGRNFTYDKKGLTIIAATGFYLT